MPVHRTLTPAKQALRQGFRPFIRYMWEHETIVTISCVLGGAPIIAWFLMPQSYFKKINDHLKVVPEKYPQPIRYVEGKTEPPTNPWKQD